MSLPRTEISLHCFQIYRFANCILFCSGYCEFPSKEKTDWLADQWDERSVLRHAQFFKERGRAMTLRSILCRLRSASTGFRLFWNKSKTFTVRIPNNFRRNLNRFSFSVSNKSAWNERIIAVSIILFSKC